MFPADSLNPQYFEEQAAKYAAKRLAQTQAATVQSSTTTSPMATRPNTPANSISQPKTGLLGNLFHGLVKAYDYQELGYKSTSSTPGSSPGCEKSELEALIAEKKRDADICSMPTW